MQGREGARALRGVGEGGAVALAERRDGAGGGEGEGGEDAGEGGCGGGGERGNGGEPGRVVRVRGWVGRGGVVVGGGGVVRGEEAGEERLEERH